MSYTNPRGNQHRHYEHRESTSPHLDTAGRWGKDSSVKQTNNSRDRDRNYEQSYSNSNIHYNDNNSKGQEQMGAAAERILREREEQERLKKEKYEESLMTEEELLQKQLGFSSFGSTKGKHVRGANPFFARVEKKRKYTQYLHRKANKKFNKNA